MCPKCLHHTCPRTEQNEVGFFLLKKTFFCDRYNFSQKKLKNMKWKIETTTMERKTNQDPTLSPVVNKSPLLTWSPALKHNLELLSSEVWALSCKFCLEKSESFKTFNQFEKLRSLELEAVMGGGLPHFLQVALGFHSPL